jgi:large subunit ribosomal protein L7/L12
LPFR